MSQAEADLRRELESRLRFEMMLSEISAGFINITTDRVDHTIKDAQRRVCECLDIDRSTLWQIPNGNPGTFLLAHLHQPEQGPPVPGEMRAADFFPWSVRKILAGEVIAISRLSD